MARYAMVHTESGFVVNVIEWSGDEAEWRAPSDYTMVNVDEIAAGPGFHYDGTTFTPPPAGVAGGDEPEADATSRKKTGRKAK